MSYVCYILNHISCKSLNGQIPLTHLYGVTPDISILMMYTFYQSVYYASHNKSFPPTSERKHAFWVSFGGYVGDAITHMTEFRQPIQVQSHLEMPGILVQLGHIQCT